MSTTEATIPGRVEAFELKCALPKVCLVCGEAAEGKPVSRTFHYWHPAILFGAPLLFVPIVLLLAATGMPGAIAGAMGPVWGGVLMAMGRRVKLSTPVCRRHRWVWAWRSIVVSLAFLPFLAAGIAAGAYGARAAALAANLPEFPDRGLGAATATFAGAMAGMAIGLIGWIGLYQLLRSGVPRLRRIDEEGVTLIGASSAFAAAVAETADDPEEYESDAHQEPESNTKPCPYCGKRLPSYVEACRFCKRVITGHFKNVQ